MGTFGGKQPGAGRPRKAEKFSGPIAAAEKRISDKLPFLIDKALELADGVMCAELTKEGDYNVYTRPPDRQAIEYLANRIMGKPTERMEIDDTSRLSDDELIAAVTGIIRGDAPEGTEDTGDDEGQTLP